MGRKAVVECVIVEQQRTCGLQIKVPRDQRVSCDCTSRLWRREGGVVAGLD